MDSADSSLEAWFGLASLLGFILLFIGLVLMLLSLSSSASTSGVIVIFPFFAVKTDSPLLPILLFLVFSLLLIVALLWLRGPKGLNHEIQKT
ncbi:MAG: hypothetical protein J7K45_01580 [Thaumarchaeota archaeon]|nr:hypothetical protein [Nitrososphaerota archaeon]